MCAGDVGIDDGLVLSSNEEVIEMMNGCLCCTGDRLAYCRQPMKMIKKSCDSSSASAQGFAC